MGNVERRDTALRSAESIGWGRKPMSVADNVMAEAAAGGAAEAEAVGPAGRLIPWKPLLLVAAAISVMMISVRVYQQFYAWTAGMDYFSADFQFYWMNLLYAQWVVEAVAATSILGYIWLTRDHDLDNLAPTLELRRYFRLIAFITIYVFIVYWTGSFYAEQDAAWHQVAIRDTDFTPSHIPLFYLCMPTFVIAGVAAFLYARTRLPEFSKRVSIPFVIGVSGPALMLPNLGYNEWGHTFFFMEELFSAPIHWGFVVLGWSVLALGGLLLQIMRRIVELCEVAVEDET